MLNLKFSNDITMARNVTKIAKNLDVLLNYLRDEYNQLFNRENLLFEKSFVLYLTIASNLKNDIISIGKIGDKIAQLDFKELKRKSDAELIHLINGNNLK